MFFESDRQSAILEHLPDENLLLSKAKFGFVLVRVLTQQMFVIRHDLNKHFIMAIKSNRTIAVGEKRKKQGHFSRIDSLE